MSVLKESIDGRTKNRGIEILGISVVFYDHTVFQAIFSVDMCVKCYCFASFITTELLPLRVQAGQPGRPAGAGERHAGDARVCRGL